MLKSVEIKKFRSCRSTKIEFGTSVCALTGRNGVGKSNILKAIDWVSRSVIRFKPTEFRRVDHALNTRDGIEIDFYLNLDSINYHYNFSQLLINIKDKTHPQAELPGLQESLSINETGNKEQYIFKRYGGAITIAEREDPIRLPQWIPAPSALKSFLALDDPQIKHIDQLISFFNGTSYYSLDEPSLINDKISELAYDDWKFRYQSEGLPTSSPEMRLIYMYETDRELFDEFVHIVGPNGLDIIDSIKVSRYDLSDFGLSRVEPQDEIGSFLYYLIIRPSKQMGGAGGVFPLSALSLGTRRVIQIVVSMLFDKRSLMLIEHPEDSIHPGLLRKLIDLLRTYSFQSQMIFTTHSPEVLDILEPEEIILVTAPEGSTQARKLEPDEIGLAKEFLKNEGSLSEFLEPLDNL